MSAKRSNPDGKLLDEALRLPPMSRRTQGFAMLAFFLLGGALTVFAVANPLGLPFLPSRSPAAVPGEEHAHPPGAEQLYQCPMHTEVIESEPGVCPICGMTLVPIGQAGATGQSADRGRGLESEREILYWYAPMDPTYIRDAPGLSPMGMKLVPKYADDTSTDEASGIRIDPVQVQNTGVVSSPARIEEVSRSSTTVGILDFNADHVTWINTKFEGWVEKVHVSYVGQEIRRGQPLFEIYSPELVTTQEEYLRALEYKASFENSERKETRRQAESLLASTRDRLIYWDISEEQIRALDQSRKVERRLTVLSPVDGLVAEIMDEALEGMFVQPGMNLYKIANLDTIWVHADIYESDLPWIRQGQPAVVSFRHDPGRVYRGSVLFLYPEVSRETRTLKICVEVPNADRKLRPGMYADVLIQGPPIPQALVIPQSAVIRSGERDVVFVDLGNGRFEPRQVQLGVKGQGDLIQILEGVAAGEYVVTQGQFMLDSESRLQEAIAKYRNRSSAPDNTPSRP